MQTIYGMPNNVIRRRGSNLSRSAQRSDLGETMKIKTSTTVEKEDRIDNTFVGVEITRKGTIRDIKTIEEEFCCNDMKNAWNDFVVWGSMEYVEINYCPFCGQKIEIENIETIEA